MAEIASLLNKIEVGDSLTLLKSLPDESVDLVVTSPPYFQQRKYTTHETEIGHEDTIDSYIKKLLNIFKECFRCTKSTGSLIFNLGDKYEGGSLQLVPYRFAWEASKLFQVKLINNITWVKLNPTPRQFHRRMVSSTEPFFHFVKSNEYKYYLDDILNDPEDIPIKSERQQTNVGQSYYRQIETSDLSPEEKSNAKIELAAAIEEVRRGEIASIRMKIRGIHTLAFGGQSGGRNTEIIKKGFSIIRCKGKKMQKDVFECKVESIRGGKHPAIYPKDIIVDLIKLTTDVNDIVLDPFMGSGTTAIAAKELDRNFIGFEISEDFANYARQRIKSNTQLNGIEDYREDKSNLWGWEE